MIPTDLDGTYIDIPKSTTYDIVIITGNQLRHTHYALKLQKAYPHLVKKWIQLDPQAPRLAPVVTIKNKVSLKQKVQVIFENRIKAYYKVFGFRKLCAKMVAELHDKLLERMYSKEKAKAEEQIFGFEMKELRKQQLLEPHVINPSDINSTRVIESLKDIDPYFILTLGGPLYSKELLACAKGFAINQHAGHSPEYKGTRTTEWALYHRDLNKVATTVHITSGGADDGLIIRRANPCIFPSDSVPQIMNRVIALGTDLVVEVVGVIIANDSLLVFEQPKFLGNTYLAKNMDFKMIKRIVADFKAGWLARALEAERNY